LLFSPFAAIMKAPITLLPFLLAVSGVLSFVFPQDDLYDTFEIEHYGFTDADRKLTVDDAATVDDPTSSFSRVWNGEHVDEHLAYTDSVFDAIETSLRDQVRNVESHLGQVRAFQEELNALLSIGGM